MLQSLASLRYANETLIAKQKEKKTTFRNVERPFDEFFFSILQIPTAAMATKNMNLLLRNFNL